MKKIKSFNWFLTFGFLIVATLVLPLRQSRAVEGGMGIYLLGYQSTMMGILPPPGFYFKNDIYYYNAGAGRAVLQGQVDLNLDLNVVLDVLSFTYVPKLQLPGGGFYGFGLIIPLGFAHLNASVQAGGQSVSRDGSNGGLADIVFTPLILGWHKGNYHFLFLTNVYFPTGAYSLNRAVNLGKNHFAFEPGFNFTWFDPKSGHQVSLAMGYTINLENTATNYQSGGEFHADFGYMYHFPMGLAAGAAGYVYQQVTGDSGTGAILGPFRGRVVGMGPQISYNTKFGKHDFSVAGQYYREFLGNNRFVGNAVYVTVGLKVF